MNEHTRNEIENIVRSYRISRSDIELDLDTRHNYPGEFYVMALMQFATEDLEAFLAQEDAR